MTAIMFFVKCAPLLGGAYLVRRWTGRGFAEAFPFSMLAAVALLYVFGLCGALAVGVYAVLLVGAFGCAWYLHSLIRQRDGGERKRLLAPSPACALAIIGLIVIALVCLDKVCSYWDEFSHWALAAKNLFVFDQMLHPANTIVYQTYPPALSLVQYYFLYGLPAFSEPMLYCVRSLITLSLLLPFFAHITWKRALFFVPLVLIVYLSVYLYGNYNNRALYADGMLALLMAYMLISYCIESEPTRFSLCAVGLGAFALAISKNAGAGLAVIALVPIYADLLLLRSRRGKGTTLPFVLLPLVCLALAWGSWSIYAASRHAVDPWHTAGLFDAVRDTLTNGFSPAQRTIIRQFATDFFTYRDKQHILPIVPCMLVGLLAVCTALICLLYRKDRATARRALLGGGMLLVGYGLWLLAMLVMYVLLFPPEEAVHMLGYSRYLSSYRLGALLPMLYLVFRAAQKRGWKPYAVALFAALALELLIVPIKEPLLDTVRVSETNAAARATRASYADADALADAVQKSGDMRVCYLNIETQAFVPGAGYAYYLSRYLATPAYVGILESWSLGAPRNMHDLWTKDVSAADYARLLLDSDYTHLYVRFADDAFKTQYGALFGGADNVQNDTLYAIDRTSDTAILIP